MKVLVACANGSGTSLMLSMTVRRVFKKHGLKINKIHHCAIAEGKSTANQYDVIFTTTNFKDHFKSAIENGKTVLTVKSVMSDQQVEDALKDAGII